MFFEVRLIFRQMEWRENSNLDLGGEQILVWHRRGVLSARVVRSSLHPDGKLTLLPAGLPMVLG